MCGSSVLCYQTVNQTGFPTTSETPSAPFMNRDPRYCWGLRDPFSRRWTWLRTIRSRNFSVYLVTTRLIEPMAAKYQHGDRPCLMLLLFRNLQIRIQAVEIRSVRTHTYVFYFTSWSTGFGCFTLHGYMKCLGFFTIFIEGLCTHMCIFSYLTCEMHYKWYSYLFFFLICG